DNLSESTVLRLWADIIGAGAVTPVLGRSQHGPRLIIQARLRNVQALTEDAIPVKEENMQLSTATEANAEGGTLSGSMSAHLRKHAPTVGATGRKVRVVGAGALAGTGSLSSSRQDSSTLSSGDV